MDEQLRNIIAELRSAEGTLEKIAVAGSHLDALAGVRIFLFDEAASNFDKSFRNVDIGSYSIVGLGDYTKTWVIDGDRRETALTLRAAKNVDLDLNVLSGIHEVLRRSGKPPDPDLFRVVDYIKENRFQAGIVTALAERMSTPVDHRILSDMIRSFVIFDKMASLEDEAGDVYLSEDDYAWMKEIYDSALELAPKSDRQYDLICCLLLKAFLLKFRDGTRHKAEALLRYSLERLNLFPEHEIVALAMWLDNDPRTEKAFQKLQPAAKSLPEKIKNVAWDMYHLRALETILFFDIRSSDVINLPFFASRDAGLNRYLKINPVEMLVITPEMPIILRKYGLGSLSMDPALLREVRDGWRGRERRFPATDYRAERERLFEELRRM